MSWVDIFRKGFFRATLVKRPSIFCSLFVAVMILMPACTAVAAPQRPLILVPGVLGSQLYDGNILIWGSDVVDSLSNFSRLKLIDPSRDAAKQTGLSDCLLKQYHTFSSYWSTNVYKSLVLYLERTLGYTQGKDLFVFCYDWRRSNLESAQLLTQFINKSAILSKGQFDIIAHSMGGVVTRAAIQQDQSVINRVQDLIEIGVPHRGSVNVFAPFVDGWGSLPRKLAGGMDTIREVAFSFQSVYELLPYYENCCGIGHSPPNTPSLDFHDFENWVKHLRWLYPSGVDPTLFEEHLIKPGLLRAAQLRAIMQKKLPDSIRLRVIAGRWTRTRETAYVLPYLKKVIYNYTDDRGDGTVHLQSARSSPSEDPYVSAAEHLTLYDDRSVLRLIREILEDRRIPPISDAQTPTLLGIEVLGIDLEIEPTITQTGEPVTLSLAIEFVPGKLSPDGDLMATADLVGPGGTKSLALNIVDRSPTRIVFRAQVPDGQSDGAYTIQLHVAGLSGFDVLERSFVVLK